MASTVLQVRIDENLKKETEEIFQNLGLNMSTAIRLFLNRVIIAKGLPFPMKLKADEQSSDQVEHLNNVEHPRQKSFFDPVQFLEEYMQQKKKEDEN